MLTRKCPRADLYMCTCSPESVHVLNQTVHMLDRQCMYLSLHGFRERERDLNIHAEVYVCTYSPGGVHMIVFMCAHAQLKVCMCSIEPCTCSTGDA